MKIIVFWDVAPCSLLETDRRFRGSCCLDHQGAMMEAVNTYETSVSFYQTSRRNIPEDSNLHNNFILYITNLDTQN
jgi:hypothetical protein